MKRHVLLCIVLLNVFFLNAQIKGRVIDGENKKPLSEVNIYIQKDTTGIGMSNENGEFELSDLNKINENDTIVFSYLGYLSCKYTLRDLKCLKYQVVMREYSLSLSEVVVKGENTHFFWDYASLAKLPKSLFSFGGFLSNGKIYVIAGDKTLVEQHSKLVVGIKYWKFLSDEMFIYDIAKDKWTTAEQKFTPRACHAAHLYKNRIFVLGGKRFSTNGRLEYTDTVVEVYDMDKDTLYVESINPHQAIDFISFIYKDCLYVMGGSTKEKVFSNKIHTLDLKTGIWYEMEDTIPAELCGNMNGILVGDVVYCFGGSSTKPVETIATYDLKTGRWKQVGNLKNGVSYPKLASNGNWIYIFENGCLQLYNTKTNIVNPYSFGKYLESNGLFYSEGKLYFVGGCARDGIYVYPVSSVTSVDVRRISVE